jgi:hypothetical protein
MKLASEGFRDMGPIPGRCTFGVLGVDQCAVRGRFGGQDVLKAIQPHVLGSAKVTGLYSLNPAVKT